MSRALSPSMQAALESVKGGLTPYAAAKLHNVAQSGLSRQLNKKPKICCDKCGQVIKGQ